MKAISPGKLKYPVFIFFLLSFFFINCERSTSPLLTASLHLSAEYVAVTEADLRLQTDKLPENATFEIRRGDSLIFRGALQTADITVTDTALLPAHSYRYRATLFKNGKPAAYSQLLQITTMDTTSHDFSWEIRTFGNGSSSVLYDVCIVNENNIWAVGEIYSDSAQPWLPYNAVHWDGAQWELKRIKTNACGGVDYPPIRTIFAFSENNILFGHIDASITYFDGVNFINDCSFIQKINGSINKIWGTSSDDLYVVGSSGLIAHYDGSQWQKIESGTELKIYDLLGKRHEKTDEQEILVVASNKLEGYNCAILQIKNKQSRLLSSRNIPSTLTGIWFLPGRGYWVVGSGMYFKKNIYDTTAWKRIDNGITPYYTNSIRGTDVNDIFVVGSYGEFLHFNGVNWQSKINETGFYGELYSIDVKGKLVYAVGVTVETGRVKAIILKAKHL